MIRLRQAKGCPFDGAAPTFEAFGDTCGGMSPPDWRIKCPICGVHLEERGSKWGPGIGTTDLEDEAKYKLITRWNRRESTA